MISARNCLSKVISSSIALIVFSAPLIYAEPMPLPSDEKAVASDWIVVAKYIDHAVPSGEDRARGSKEGRFLGVYADFMVEEVLKPSSDETINLLSLKKPIHVWYDFFEDGWCIPPEGVIFSESLMPPKGSQWILFINQAKSFRRFGIYRGKYGRWTASKENIGKVKQLLSALKHT
jgi:hypothetical protein